MREEAKHCNNCLCWLKHCHSECCKTFTISNAKQFKPVKGRKIVFPTKLSISRQKYYRLHGCEYVHGILRIPVNEFKWDGDNLEIRNQCEWLNNKGLCSHYNDRPEICKRLNNETKNDKDIVLTPNCLYRRKE